MQSESLSNDLAGTETEKYFRFITHPYYLEIIYPLNSFLENEKDSSNKNLWISLKERSLQCFKLCVRKNNSSWKIYYVDLETPLVFHPISSEMIDKISFQQFSQLGKTIKSNLLAFFSQEIELLFISTINSEKKLKIPFITFKLEDQVELKKINSGNSEAYSNKNLESNKSTTKTKDSLLVLKNGKKRIPFGKRTSKNHLNLLTGREWLKFSKTWFIHSPPRRVKDEILHPAKFPETMIRQFITFFTKPGELILDPFLGSGSTLIAAKQSNRSGIGVELSSFFAKISQKRLSDLKISAYPPLYQTKDSCFWEVICEDSRYLSELWSNRNFPEVDFCISSPPYWNQLERDTIRHKARKKQGLNTKYSLEDKNDLGNVKCYKEFLSEQKKIFDQVYQLLRPNAYLVIITNNVFARGCLFPLAYDTATSLTQDTKHNWVLKDEKIWLQDDKSLIALGINYAWVGNRCHQYCLIFRKEGKK